MISDNPLIQQLVALLLGHGVTDAVLCPGSRNAPIVHSLLQQPGLQCHNATDERSAGFQALGLALANRRPTVVCVTSGSALLNLHPAVAEAYYSRAPLVVVSADRPRAWIGQMDGQTLPQPGAFGTLVKHCAALPEVHTDTDLWHANCLINEALLAATHNSGGPVHINVPIAEPFYEFHTPELPEARLIRRLPCKAEALRELAPDGRILILVGQHPGGLDMPEGYLTMSEHLGNAATLVRGRIDELFASLTDAEAMRPTLLVTLGGHIVSKHLKQYFRHHPPRYHCHISPDGHVADTYRCLTHIIEAEPAQLLTTLEHGGGDPAFTRLWLDASQALPEPKPTVVGELLSRLPHGAVLHLANSSSVRLADRYRMPNGVAVACNRGVNGIEGCLSTAVGYAMANPQQPNFVVIGDLAFFYDQNALWRTALPNNLHILLLNDGGGAIFETLPLPNDARSMEAICGRHTTQAEPLCRQYGVRYLEGAEKMKEFVESNECVLLEIKTI